VRKREERQQSSHGPRPKKQRQAVLNDWGRCRCRLGYARYDCTEKGSLVGTEGLGLELGLESWAWRAGPGAGTWARSRSWGAGALGSWGAGEQWA
jgi:hypothetical protein